jgi:AraC-like DNA-binding protein
MQMAGELFLSRPEFSIPQVAEQVGYASEWAFAKAFKRHHGSAPGAFRRSREPPSIAST